MPAAAFACPWEMAPARSIWLAGEVALIQAGMQQDHVSLNPAAVWYLLADGCFSSRALPGWGGESKQKDGEVRKSQ